MMADNEYVVFSFNCSDLNMALKTPYNFSKLFKRFKQNIKKMIASGFRFISFRAPTGGGLDSLQKLTIDGATTAATTSSDQNKHVNIARPNFDTFSATMGEHKAVKFGRDDPIYNFATLIPQLQLEEVVKIWLQEDAPNFDVGGFVVGDREETAAILCKSPGILAGIPFVNAIFDQLGCKVTWLKVEGKEVEPICKVATVQGKVRALLLGERIALNCLSRASGIATLGRLLSSKCQALGWKGCVAGTRKTTPGFRIVEKYALLIGGVDSHRFDLSSAVMLKDNHIWSVGSINEAVTKARRAAGPHTKIEVECRSVEEAGQAAVAGCDIVMLDNFAPPAVHKSAETMKSIHPHIIIEVSGGIHQNNIESYVSPHIDIISCGELTHGYKIVDFSFKLLKDGRDPENPLVTL